jgi:hypothetical protein
MDRPTLIELNKRDIEGFFLSDKGWCHNYLKFYDELFAPFRDSEINIFEVGYLHGGSAQLWEKYFTKAIIKSIDINPCVPPPTSSRIILELKDIKDVTVKYFKDFVPDIAIDDGSHLLEDQIYFVKTVYPALRKGGLLIVEDIQNDKGHKHVFECLNIPFEVIDLRTKLGRFDDVIFLYRK